MTRALADLADEEMSHSFCFLGLTAQPGWGGGVRGTQVPLKRGGAVVRIKQSRRAGILRPD